MKEVASNEKVWRGLHGAHRGVVLEMGIGAEREDY